MRYVRIWRPTRMDGFFASTLRDGLKFCSVSSGFGRHLLAHGMVGAIFSPFPCLLFRLLRGGAIQGK